MTVRPHAVAAFVAFQFASMLVLSLPVLPNTIADGRASPDLDTFVGSVTGALGPSADGPTRAVARGYARSLRAVRSGFLPLARLCGTHQGWTMFGSVPDEVERFEIHVRRGSRWEPLYVAGSDEADWRRGFFENERMRTLVHGMTRAKKSRFGQLADWALREATSDDPSVTQVRVRFVRLTIPPAEELARTGVLREGKAFRSEARP